MLAADRLPVRLQANAVLGAAAGGLLAALVVSGIDLELLRPRNWATLAEGLASGLQSVGTVRLPYEGTDPWPRAALELLGSVMLVLAALLACWPRSGPRQSRGYPFMALALLLVLVASPVVSLGGARPLLLGTALAALTVCFLWLERLPLRPGLGVAALLGVALAGSLPLAAVADRGEPWFDYRAFAEGIGPDDPIRFSWAQSYGPIDWPRDGNEVMRVRSDKPHYWKAANLAEFDGRGWTVAALPDAAATTPRPSCATTGATSRAGATGSRSACGGCSTRDVVAPGAILGVEGATRPLSPAGEPGRWTAASELRRGDSYSADVYVPDPSAVELREADVGRVPRPAGERAPLHGPVRRGPRADRAGARRRDRRAACASAVVHLRPFGEEAEPFVTFPSIGRTRYGIGAIDRAMRRTPYARTWELAQRLRSGAESPYDYVLAIDGYLQDRASATPSGPPRPAPGRRAARRVPARHALGLLPALRGRDGAAAAHGRRARARGDRLQPRRLLAPPGRVDRARHRRARVGRGVVRRHRLGHVRPDAAVDAGALADRRDRDRPPPEARGRRAGRGRGAGRRRAAGDRPGGLRADLAQDVDPADPDAAGGRRRRRRDPVVGLRGRRPARRRARVGGRSRGAAAGRRRPGRRTARSPSSSARCGAAGARRRRARRCASSSSGSAARPR